VFTAFTIILVIISVLLVLKNPEYFIYIVIIDAFWTVRFYSSFYGIPAMLIPAGLLVMKIMTERKNILPRGKLIFLYFFLSLYMFISYYSYFDKAYLVLFNNIITLMVILFVMPKVEWKQLKSITYVVTAMGILLSIFGIISFISGNERLLGNPRQVAFYIICTMPFVFTMTYFPQEYRVKKIWLRIILLFMFIGTIALQGRMSIFLAGVLLLFYCITIEKKIITAVYILIISIVMLYNANKIIKASEKIFFRHSGEFTLDLSALMESGSFTSGRSVIYEDANEMFWDHPIFGYGFMSFKSPNPYNRYSGGWRTEGVSVHSIHRQYLAELGLVGWGLYMLILMGIFILGIKNIIKYKNNQNHIAYSVGIICLSTSILFLVEGLFDNNGFQNRQLTLCLFLLYTTATVHCTMKDKSQITGLEI
jgi:O-antigen ligase